jgi:hypothetical protein
VRSLRLAIAIVLLLGPGCGAPEPRESSASDGFTRARPRGTWWPFCDRERESLRPLGTVEVAYPGEAAGELAARLNELYGIP